MARPTAIQWITVALALAAGAVSLAVVAAGFAARGEVAVTPLLGGTLMLALGVSGFFKLRGRS